MSGVRLDNIQKVYPNGYVAVKDTSLHIEDGEFIILVGPSGCGKSTLLRMVAGLEDVTSGTIRIGDTVVNDVAPKNRNISMVFQNYALYPHMSVRENMGFALKQARLPKGEIEKRVANAAEILGLDQMLDRKPKELSGGQRQRVAVGRAIVRDAEVFLFDEPLSNLDASLRTQMRTEISKLHQRLGKTMIYVTHDQVEAMTMADRIVVLKGGGVLQFDTPLEIYRRPASRFVAEFIGSPSMNMLEGVISSRNGSGGLRFEDASSHVAFDIPDRVGSQFDLSADSKVVMGVRPEDIRFGAEGQTDDSAAIDLWVDVVEPMGNEVVMHGKLAEGDGASLVARDRIDEPPRVGSQVKSRIDLSKISFFDAVTEQTLARS